MPERQFLLNGAVEVRMDDDGKFDELVIQEDCASSVHFEMMDDNTLWIGLYPLGPKGNCVHVTVSARGKLSVSAFEA